MIGRVDVSSMIVAGAAALVCREHRGTGGGGQVPLVVLVLDVDQAPRSERVMLGEGGDGVRVEWRARLLVPQLRVRADQQLERHRDPLAHFKARDAARVDVDARVAVVVDRLLGGGEGWQRRPDAIRDVSRPRPLLAVQYAPRLLALCRIPCDGVGTHLWGGSAVRGGDG